ncbi:hypothetical protein SLE2022_153380 [Rubroshorea leprosula]
MCFLRKAYCITICRDHWECLGFKLLFIYVSSCCPFKEYTRQASAIFRNYRSCGAIFLSPLHSQLLVWETSIGDQQWEQVIAQVKLLFAAAVQHHMNSQKDCS